MCNECLQTNVALFGIKLLRNLAETDTLSRQIPMHNIASVPMFDKFSQLFASFTLGSLKIAQSCILTKITPVKIGSRSFRLRSYIALSSC